MTTIATVRDNPALSRFELAVDGHTAFVEYQRGEGVITLVHTSVPKAIGGRGIGTRIVRDVLDKMRNEGLKVVPRCSFIKAYIDRHPAYADLLA